MVMYLVYMSGVGSVIVEVWPLIDALRNVMNLDVLGCLEARVRVLLINRIFQL
jgi:hypothetical protein